MENLKFAIFGCGFWSQFQLGAWTEIEGAECVALYNLKSVLRLITMFINKLQPTN